MNPQEMTSPSLADIAFQQGRRLAADPNIRAVGYGTKLTKGAPAGSSCLVFLVNEKLSSPAEILARGSWVIPPHLAGVPTDVVETGRLRASTADRALPTGTRGTHVATPLVGGTATMGLGGQLPGPAGYGTMGGLCFDTSTGTPLLVSNAHVWGQTVGTEVTQPVSPATVFGASASSAIVGTTPLTVLTRTPVALNAPIAFANSVGQTYLVAGSDADPLVFGQGATPVAGSARTDSEQVTIAAPVAGVAPAGKRLSPTVGWTYQRFATTAVQQASSSAPRTPTKLLSARRLFTNAASYTSGQTVNLYAEVIPASGGAPATASAHFPVVFLYPLPAGDKVVTRLLRPAARQTPTTVTTQFSGFPAPARVGNVNLPFSVTVAPGAVFTVDSDAAGTFQTPPAGSLPANTFVLKLPATTVRLFVPPSTQMVLDIDLRGIPGPFAAQGVNSAGDNTGTVTTAAGTSGRTLVTIAASEIVEVRLTGAGNALVFAMTSARSSPETTAPLSYAGSVPVSSLSSGHWAASLFVQALDGGLTESANVVATAIGQQGLVADCRFDVA